VAESNETSELQKLRAQRDALDRELVRKTYRIGELEQERDFDLADAARAFEESLSWRITSPLRKLMELARKLRHR
jgi:hypothetical protein